MSSALLRPPSWTADAHCSDHPQLDATHWDRCTPQARAVCETCPVRYQCAQEALADAIPEGLWGGLDPTDRREIAAGHGYRHPGAATHGTRACYVAGCRRDECRAAHATYERERKRKHAPTTTRRHAA